MTPVRFNSVLRRAISRYEERNGVHYADVGEYLTAWRKKEYQRRIYEEAVEAASPDVLYDMADDWDIVISLAMLETEALRAQAFLDKHISAASSAFMIAVTRTINEICAVQLRVGIGAPSEGSLSQQYLLDMLRRANPNMKE
jgi:hypothetical protein